MEVIRITDLFKLFSCNINGPVAKEAIGHLVEWGLIPKEGVYKCPNGHLLTLRMLNNIDGWVWTCIEKSEAKKQRSRPCSPHISFRKGTFFAKSQSSISQVLQFVLLWCKNLPLSDIMEEAAIESPTTGVDLNNLCREVVVFSSFQSSVPIGGPGVVVEIDESKIGKRKYCRGHFVEGQWIFGAVERESGRCFMVPVEDRTSESLIPIINQNIRPGSIIVSNGLKSYERLLDEEYTHFTVNRLQSFVDPVTQHHTNTIKSLWRQLKASLPRFYRRTIYCNGYVQKFLFLRWCEANNKNKFVEFCRYAGRLYDPMQLPDAEKGRSEEEPVDLYFTIEGSEEFEDVNPLG